MKGGKAMKILFITYDFYPDFDANSLIVNSLSENFILQGNEVHILTLKPSPRIREEELWNNINIHRSSQSYDKLQVSKYFADLKVSLGLKLLTSILINKFKKKEYLHSCWSFHSTKRMKYIINKHDIDIVINVCYPFESCLPILKYLKKYNKTFKWILYMQDPFATQHHYLNKYSKNELMNFQSKVFSMADKIIITPPIAEELKKCESQKFLEKSTALNFPKIIKPIYIAVNDDIQFNSMYINCIYVGKFNKDIRNPMKLFKMFEKLNDDNIRLHIIGENKQSWEEYLSGTDSNIFFHGSRSRNACINAELNADILINLGNNVNNQLPSKILEYISTGKPIFNLYKIKDCTTLEYMKKYPICLNTLEENKDNSENIQELRDFCKRYKYTSIDYNIIKEKYFECTVQNVSNEFMNLFYELIYDKENV